MPWASLAATLAVQGATSRRSAHSARAMWGMGSKGSPNSPTITGAPVSARNVAGPTNSVALRVMATRTSAPRRCSARSTSTAL